jgi:hypothetical protein
MAWTRIQSAEAGFFGTAVTATYGTNVSSGTKLIAYVTSGFSDAPTSVKDAAANAFTLLGSVATAAGSVWLYARDTPAGDVGTKPAITATFPSSNGQAILVQEVSGLLAGNTTAMIDGTPGTKSGTTAATGSPTYSSTAASEYLICAYGAATATTAPTVLSGWTGDPNNTGGSGGGGAAVVEYKNSTGGAETSGFTGADTSGWSILTVAFKLTAAAAPAAAVPPLLKGPRGARKGTLAGAVAPPPVVYPSVPSRFYLPRALLRGKPPPNTRTRTSKTLVPATAPPPPAPAPFYAPHSLLRGARAAVRGRLSGLRGQPAVPAPFPLVVRVQAILQGFTGRKGKTFGQAAPPPTTYPSPPTPQHQLLHPAPHAGKGKLTGTIAPAPVIRPSVPSPFFAPAALLRGARAAVRGTLASVRGLAGRPSPFRLPGLLRPAAAGAGRPRTTLTGTAAPEPAVIPPAPAPFYPPHSLLRPAPTGAHRGQGFRGIAPQPVTMPGVPSPFYAPHSPLRPASQAARPGRLTRTSYGRPGLPAPFTPPHGPLRPAPSGSVRPRSVLTGSAAPAPVIAPSAPAPFYPPHSPLRGRVPGRPRTTITGVAAPPPVIHPPVTYLGIWQGSTHMVAQNADNLILGSNHPGPGGPGDERGDLERSS